jgi:hypothetical protein
MDRVQKFYRKTNVTIQLEEALPTDVFYSAYASNFKKNKSYIFRKQILEFDFGTEIAEIVDELPFVFESGSIHSSVAFTVGDKVWVFAGAYTLSTPRALIFDMETKEVSHPEGNFSNLPLLFRKPAIVSSGEFAYIVGGFGSLPDTDGSYYATNGILR